VYFRFQAEDQVTLERPFRLFPSLRAKPQVIFNGIDKGLSDFVNAGPLKGDYITSINHFPVKDICFFIESHHTDVAFILHGFFIPASNKNLLTLFCF
jgi:hypothetical protein